LSTNPHIRMIFEGSCDTEDWSNYAKYSSLLQLHTLYTSKDADCQNVEFAFRSTDPPLFILPPRNFIIPAVPQINF